MSNNKFTCLCGNEFEDRNDIDAIEIQWTKFDGCDVCMAMLPIETIEADEPIIDLNRKKTRF